MHAAAINGGRPGVLHGNRTYLLQDADGQITEAHSISAGLDYPGIGPEHAFLHDVGRVTYLSATDEEAVEAFQLLRPPRGHPAGAGVRPRAGPAAATSREIVGQDGVIVRQPLRPRRQGPRHGRRSAWTGRRMSVEPHRRPLRRAEAPRAAPGSSPM